LNQKFHAGQKAMTYSQDKLESVRKKDKSKKRHSCMRRMTHINSIALLPIKK
jgi:hypothetical protein